MKRILGNIVTLFVVLTPFVFCSEPFSLTIRPSTDTPYLKESVLLSVDINQTDPEPVLLFHFRVEPSEAYRVRQIYARHDDTLHHTVHHNLYEIYPLKTGDLNISFRLVKRVTNDEKVRYFASGDRDDFKKLDTDDHIVPVAPVSLHVKPLPEEGTELVGNFHIEAPSIRKSVQAYEPIPIRIVIEGEGFPPLLQNIVPKSDRYTLFQEKPVVNIRHTQKGTHSRIVYDMAISAARSFYIPPGRIRAFDPKRERTYFLQIPEMNVTVTPVDTGALVDKEDTPPPYRNGAENLSGLFGYLIVFIAGVLTGRLYKTRTTNENEENELDAKIDACKEASSLLRVLIAHDAARFAPLIERIERDLYEKDARVSLRAYKQEAKELLS